MDLHAHVDIYCERTDPSLLAEPLNAVTNLAFLLAAWLCWRNYAHTTGSLDKSGTFLMVLVGFIGIGSGLLHTFATNWALLADVIPIAIFVNAFLFFAMGRFFGWNKVQSAMAVVAFFGLAAYVKNTIPNEVLNGSAGYLPPFAALTAMGIAMVRQGHPHADYLLYACAVFFISLSMRTLDQAVCSTVPFGTHFLWHTFNGVSLYLVGKAYFLSRKPA